MQKEEQILFPLIRAGRGRQAAMPIQVHRARARAITRRNLARLRELTDGYTTARARPAPPGARSTWA